MDTLFINVTEQDDELETDHIYLLPSVFILLLLSFVERRQKVCSFEKRFPCLRGRFGIVVPLDFTSSLENRWSHAFAFGAITPLIFSLFFGFTNPIPYTPPRYLKVFVYLVAALEVGFICKPFFACLSAPNQMLGGILGLLYTLTWFIIKLWDFIWCKWPTRYDDKSFEGFSLHCNEGGRGLHALILLPVNTTQIAGRSLGLLFSLFWFTTSMYELVWCNDWTAVNKGLRDYLLENEWVIPDLPHLLCLGFLVCRFGYQVVMDILNCLKKQNQQTEINKEQYKIIATVVLCFLSLYMMVMLELVFSLYVFDELYDMWDKLSHLFTKSDFIQHLKYLKWSWYVSSACAIFSSVVHISRVLVCYRKQIKSLWAGQKIYLPRKYHPSPTSSLGGLLKYPSYQIAFILWGYLIVHLALFLGGLVFVYMVISPICTNGFQHWLTDLIIVLANFFVVLAVMGLQRMFIHMFFLQDKNSPMDKDKPLALNNRKVFHNVNYFLFFFNVILGVMSCMMRLIKSSAVGLMLLPRIERAIMPQGFERLDKCYCTWVGMIITDHHHSNPVLLCFCHLLLRRVRVDETLGSRSERAVRERARTRWFLMYTLVRNPKLILMRTRVEQSKNDREFAFAWAVANTP
ncbi:hypothetical protein Q7C36_001562 [Tachysurus vachellii]|uniref:Stimulated by retinoic acid gene 6 protein-like n=1 Tax=Tachysurus vachellii TaxID=175792 RepID=A0AA88TFR5_TACVA|nr:hypothetical protein Q7C36_001562 [Tachysurus vachellii]